MAQASAEKLEHTGPAEKERVASAQKKINSRFIVVVRSPAPFGCGSKWLLAFPRVPVTPGKKHPFVHCNWPRPSRLSHAETPSSLCDGFSSSQFWSFLVFTFLSFHLKISFVITIHKMEKPLGPPSVLSLSLLHLKDF